MFAEKITALVATVLWVLAAIVVGMVWMGEEYALIEQDNGDGTVTFRDGPDKATSTDGEFFATALKNTLIIVFYFPTLPYLIFMLVLGIVCLFTRERRPPEEPAPWPPQYH